MRSDREIYLFIYMKRFSFPLLLYIYIFFCSEFSLVFYSQSLFRFRIPGSKISKVYNCKDRDRRPCLPTYFVHNSRAFSFSRFIIYVKFFLDKQPDFYGNGLDRYVSYFYENQFLK